MTFCVTPDPGASGRAEVVRVARPSAATGTVPSTDPPSDSVTVPKGLPLKAARANTWTVKVTGRLTRATVVEGVTVMGWTSKGWEMRAGRGPSPAARV